jgi:hypothetical protein
MITSAKEIDRMFAKTGTTLRAMLFSVVAESVVSTPKLVTEGASVQLPDEKGTYKNFQNVKDQVRLRTGRAGPRSIKNRVRRYAPRPNRLPPAPRWIFNATKILVRGLRGEASMKELEAIKNIRINADIKSSDSVSKNIYSSKNLDIKIVVNKDGSVRASSTYKSTASALYFSSQRRSKVAKLTLSTTDKKGNIKNIKGRTKKNGFSLAYNKKTKLLSKEIKASMDKVRL